MDFDAIRRRAEQDSQHLQREVEKRIAFAKPKLNELADYLKKNLVKGFSLHENGSTFIVKKGAIYESDDYWCYFTFWADPRIDDEKCFIADGQSSPGTYEAMADNILTRLQNSNALKKLK